MMDWREDPEFCMQTTGDITLRPYPGTITMKVAENAVAAYKRYLTSEIEELPTAHYPGVGTVLEKSDVLALIEQQEDDRKENDERDR